jgi:hypothetical protein
METAYSSETLASTHTSKIHYNQEDQTQFLIQNVCNVVRYTDLERKLLPVSFMHDFH